MDEGKRGPHPDDRSGAVRQFSTGATRDTDKDKFDYEGFLSPKVLQAYAAYMHSHRKQSDGTLRDSDNWKKGIPRAQYMKSLWRHFMEFWSWHRGPKDWYSSEMATKLLCAIMFNTMGYLHEILEGRDV